MFFFKSVIVNKRHKNVRRRRLYFEKKCTQDTEEQNLNLFLIEQTRKNKQQKQGLVTLI